MMLRKGNIVRVVKDNKVIICTISKLYRDYALVKYEDKKYYLNYFLIDEVIGHEHLVRSAE